MALSEVDSYAVVLQSLSHVRVVVSRRNALLTQQPSKQPPNDFGLSDFERPIQSKLFVLLVPGGGVEPPRGCPRRILSPLRLPVPPSRLGTCAFSLTRRPTSPHLLCSLSRVAAVKRVMALLFDILAWLRQQGQQSYQSRFNALLRRIMVQDLETKGNAYSQQTMDL